jgi:hypothetical protein
MTSDVAKPNHAFGDSFDFLTESVELGNEREHPLATMSITETPVTETPAAEGSSNNNESSSSRRSKSNKSEESTDETSSSKSKRPSSSSSKCVGVKGSMDFVTKIKVQSERSRPSSRRVSTSDPRRKVAAVNSTTGIIEDEKTSDVPVTRLVGRSKSGDLPESSEEPSRRGVRRIRSSTTSGSNHSSSSKRGSDELKPSRHRPSGISDEGDEESGRRSSAGAAVGSRRPRPVAADVPPSRRLSDVRPQRRSTRPAEGIGEGEDAINKEASGGNSGEHKTEATATTSEQTSDEVHSSKRVSVGASASHRSERRPTRDGGERRGRREVSKWAGLKGSVDFISKTKASSSSRSREKTRSRSLEKTRSRSLDRSCLAIDENNDAKESDETNTQASSKLSGLKGLSSLQSAGGIRSLRRSNSESSLSIAVISAAGAEESDERPGPLSKSFFDDEDKIPDQKKKPNKWSLATSFKKKKEKDDQHDQRGLIMSIASFGENFAQGLGKMALPNQRGNFENIADDQHGLMMSMASFGTDFSEPEPGAINMPETVEEQRESEEESETDDQVGDGFGAWVQDPPTSLEQLTDPGNVATRRDTFTKVLALPSQMFTKVLALPNQRGNFENIDEGKVVEASEWESIEDEVAPKPSTSFNDEDKATDKKKTSSKWSLATSFKKEKEKDDQHGLMMSMASFGADFSEPEPGAINTPEPVEEQDKSEKESENDDQVRDGFGAWVQDPLTSLEQLTDPGNAASIRDTFTKVLALPSQKGNLENVDERKIVEASETVEEQSEIEEENKTGDQVPVGEGLGAWLAHDPLPNLEQSTDPGNVVSRRDMFTKVLALPSQGSNLDADAPQCSSGTEEDRAWLAQDPLPNLEQSTGPGNVASRRDMFTKKLAVPSQGSNVDADAPQCSSGTEEDQSQASSVDCADDYYPTMEEGSGADSFLSPLKCVQLKIGPDQARGADLSVSIHSLSEGRKAQDGLEVHHMESQGKKATENEFYAESPWKDDTKQDGKPKSKNSKQSSKSGAGKMTSNAKRPHIKKTPERDSNEGVSKSEPDIFDLLESKIGMSKQLPGEVEAELTAEIFGHEQKDSETATKEFAELSDIGNISKDVTHDIANISGDVSAEDGEDNTLDLTIHSFACEEYTPGSPQWVQASCREQNSTDKELEGQGDDEEIIEEDQNGQLYPSTRVEEGRPVHSFDERVEDADSREIKSTQEGTSIDIDKEFARITKELEESRARTQDSRSEVRAFQQEIQKQRLLYGEIELRRQLSVKSLERQGIVLKRINQ